MDAAKDTKTAAVIDVTKFGYFKVRRAGHSTARHGTAAGEGEGGGDGRTRAGHGMRSKRPAFGVCQLSKGLGGRGWGWGRRATSAVRLGYAGLCSHPLKGCRLGCGGILCG